MYLCPEMETEMQHEVNRMNGDFQSENISVYNLTT